MKKQLELRNRRSSAIVIIVESKNKALNLGAK